MHARLDELLSLRDGAPVDARVRAHVDECAECTAELARAESLQQDLRALATAPDAAADGWAEVQSRLAAARAKGSLAARVAPYAAAASVVALALFAARNPSPEAAVFTWPARPGPVRVATRMRLATSQAVVAAARMSDGTVWTRRVDVLVTLAACVEG